MLRRSAADRSGSFLGLIEQLALDVAGLPLPEQIDQVLARFLRFAS